MPLARVCGNEFQAMPSDLSHSCQVFCSAACYTASGRRRIPRSSELERFWSKVRKTDGCWIWTGRFRSKDYGGFGVLRDGRWQTVYAHRYAYETIHGPIPLGLVLHHRCKTQSCVNPDHLAAVTPSVNMALGKPTPTLINASKTHCINGHELSGNNVYRHGLGNRHRMCKQCAKMRLQRSIPLSRIRHPEAYKARIAVRDALISGKLQRIAYCQLCLTSDTRIEAHHQDYSRPLEIVWLCVWCHRHVEGRVAKWRRL